MLDERDRRAMSEAERPEGKVGNDETGYYVLT
jgi:hypothetical protein